MQRRGLYPPPPGASDILGLEVCGLVTATGSDVTRWTIGDRVMALVSGGGYAEFVLAHEDLAIAAPADIVQRRMRGRARDLLYRLDQCL